MKKKMGTTAMLLFLGLTIAFQLAYYMWIRGTISFVGTFANFRGQPWGESPRDVADHFVCCVRVVHDFLLGYLYCVQRHYEEKSLKGQEGKIKFWVGMEVMCQLGIFVTYYLVWISNRILYYILDKDDWIVANWHVGTAETVIYYHLRDGKKIIPATYAWGEKYWNIFVLAIIIAPILLMMVIYSVHLVCRIKQFKRSGYLNKVWVIWNVVFVVVMVLVVVRWFYLLKFSEGWNMYLHNPREGG
ncbi:MAG: hypothetical protein J1E62_00600 [Lachnospiraceae bacterium]|nr:hypothetical protein [Lachnospiraceae bacterium]